MTDKMVTKITEQTQRHEEWIADKDYQLECMEPEMNSYEEVLLKYEMDLEQGQRDLDEDDDRMRQYEEEIEDLRLQNQQVEEERLLTQHESQALDQHMMSLRQEKITLDV